MPWCGAALFLPPYIFNRTLGTWGGGWMIACSLNAVLCLKHKAAPLKVCIVKCQVFGMYHICQMRLCKLSFPAWPPLVQRWRKVSQRKAQTIWSHVALSFQSCKKENHPQRNIWKKNDWILENILRHMASSYVLGLSGRGRMNDHIISPGRERSVYSCVLKMEYQLINCILLSNPCPPHPNPKVIQVFVE